MMHVRDCRRSGIWAGRRLIVDALKRLEYRGYDSAGVATLENGKLERRRAEGKLRNLEAKLAAAPLSGAIGIGHTRWATHGKPTETTAHPHASARRRSQWHHRKFQGFARGAGGERLLVCDGDGF
jgi:glucosamine 6-phosphate synthetase-like amidotransferase/phosphosugar isomerase protein